MRAQGVLLLLTSLAGCNSVPEGVDLPKTPGQKIYGEWRIHVKPDKGPEYAQLIQEKGLPLFREAGGRMVGWWTTLIGDLYEHVTIWEYDGMPAFEKAVQFLSKDDRFAKFVALRDPLLAGEESRFLWLASSAEKPSLPQAGNFVLHEVQHVPYRHQKLYSEVIREAIRLLKRRGFRLAGPWWTSVGDATEVTYLISFESLAERDRLIEAVLADPESQDLKERLGALSDRSTSRLLVPATFAR